MSTATEARVGRPEASHALASVQGHCGPPWGQQGAAWVAVAVILARVIVNLKVPVHLGLAHAMPCARCTRLRATQVTAAAAQLSVEAGYI